MSGKKVLAGLVAFSAWWGLSTAGVTAAELSHDELVQQARKEGSLIIYSNSSRHSMAGAAFEKKYGIKVQSTQLKDIEIIEKIAAESTAKVKGADLVFVQDGGRVYGELLAPGHLVNYVPPSLAGKISKADADPLVFMYLIKAVEFNTEKRPSSKTSTSPLSNIWQLTDPEWKGRFQMKDPFQEAVNMNFLTMLTKPENAQKIAAAYKAHYGKPIQLTTPNAGYEWIKALYANGVVFGTSDTKITEAVGARGQDKLLAGLVTLNKTVAAETKKLDLGVAQDMKPFLGFYYPMYCLIPSNAKNTAAAKLFAEYVLTPEGFAPWSGSKGDYSPNPDVKPMEGERPLAAWLDSLVREDPQWCFEHRAEVEDFLNSII